MRRTNPVRRPVLPRSQPIRDFAGVFGGRATPADDTSATAAGKNPAPKNGTAKNGSVKNGSKKPGGDPGATVARGVSAGYRVIEQYLQQGQDFARSLWPGSDSGAGGTAEAPMNMTERLIRSASDLAGLFSEFLQTFSMPGTLPPPGSTPIPDFGLGHAGAAGRAATTSTPPTPAAVEAPAVVSIDLQSRRRAEVTVHVRPGTWTGRLQVHDLRSPTGAAALTGTTATGIASDRRVLVAVSVPDELPADTYSGLIVDAETNLPRGTIAVRIFSAAVKPRKAARPAKAGRRRTRPAR